MLYWSTNKDAKTAQDAAFHVWRNTTGRSGPIQADHLGDQAATRDQIKSKQQPSLRCPGNFWGPTWPKPTRSIIEIDQSLKIAQRNNDDNDANPTWPH